MKTISKTKKTREGTTYTTYFGCTEEEFSVAELNRRVDLLERQYKYEMITVKILLVVSLLLLIVFST